MLAETPNYVLPYGYPFRDHWAWYLPFEAFPSVSVVLLYWIYHNFALRASVDNVEGRYDFRLLAIMTRSGNYRDGS